MFASEVNATTTLTEARTGAVCASAGTDTIGFAVDGKAWRQHEPEGPAGAFFDGPPQQAWLGAGAAATHSGGAKDARKASATPRPNALRIIATL